MKVWRFYVKCDSIHKEILPEEAQGEYALYAVTNHKKRAERFMTDRNMNVFKVVSSDMEKEDYIAYINDDNNRNYVLEYQSFETRSLSKNGYYDTKSVELLVTMFEYMNCSEDEFATFWIDVMREEWWIAMPPVECFSDEIRSSLKSLRYMAMYNLMGSSSTINVIDELVSPDVYIDEVSVFIQVYRDVLAV